MMNEEQRFFISLRPRILSLIRGATADCLHCAAYTVTTAPAGGRIGVTRPGGTTELSIPHSPSLSTAALGDSVMVLWYGSLSSAHAFPCF